MGRENKKYFCSEQMGQWFQKMFVVEQSGRFCFKWNMCLICFAIEDIITVECDLKIYYCLCL